MHFKGPRCTLTHCPFWQVSAPLAQQSCATKVLHFEEGVEPFEGFPLPPPVVGDLGLMGGDRRRGGGVRVVGGRGRVFCGGGGYCCDPGERVEDAFAAGGGGEYLGVAVGEADGPEVVGPEVVGPAVGPAVPEHCCSCAKAVARALAVAFAWECGERGGLRGEAKVRVRVEPWDPHALHGVASPIDSESSGLEPQAISSNYHADSYFCALPCPRSLAPWQWQRPLHWHWRCPHPRRRRLH